MSGASGTLFGPAAGLDTIRGTIHRIVYNENGRTIAKITLARESLTDRDGKRRPSIMSVLGAMAEPQIGQMYEFCGAMEWDGKYKQHQLKFESYRTVLPDDRDGIVSYLVDVARWVGPAIAKQLVDAFGDQTLTVLKTEPDRVKAMGVPNLTVERIQEMQTSLQLNEKLEAAMVEVNNLLNGCMGPTTVRKAIKKWGCDAATFIKENPFVLMSLYGVGFVSADAVHKKLNGDPAAIARHHAAVCHVLSEAAGREGHTVLPIDRVTQDASRLVGALRPEVFEHCIQEQAIGCDGATVSLADNSGAEKYIAAKIASMLARAGEEADRRLYPEISTEGLADDQAAAVRAFQNSPVFILCGAPGTGKTYTLARIVRTCKGNAIQVALCAPTGKAAKQMALALADVCADVQAQTIHSLLQPLVDEETGEFSFQRNETNPLDADLVVVDEFSMVDVSLCRSLLRAIPDTSRLLIVGDHYQLPSVGPGAVLRDLLAADVPHHELTAIKRNAGLIVRACHAIKDGRVPEPASRLDLENGANWRHIPAGDPAEIKAIIETLIRNQLPKAGINMRWGWQLISPTNEAGELSCDALNELARGILNPTEQPPKGLHFAVGDKVVRCKNGIAIGRVLPEVAEVDESVQVPPGLDAEIRIVNGDIGFVRGIDDKRIEVDLRYPRRRVFIGRSAHHLKRAYCLTCHKMQGSEVPVVILPLHQSYARMPMVTREWLYTALSRAKQFIVTVGDIEAMRPMVRRVGTHLRGTRLRGMLEQLKGFEI